MAAVVRPSPCTWRGPGRGRPGPSTHHCRTHGHLTILHTNRDNFQEIPGTWQIFSELSMFPGADPPEPPCSDQPRCQLLTLDQIHLPEFSHQLVHVLLVHVATTAPVGPALGSLFHTYRLKMIYSDRNGSCEPDIRVTLNDFHKFFWQDWKQC